LNLNETEYVLKILVPLIGGAWFLYSYFKEGLHAPKMEFDITCQVIESLEATRIIEFKIIASNKGKIRVTFPKIEFRIRGIEDKKNTGFFQGTKRLQFPSLIFKENLIPEKYIYYYVEPGTCQVFTYITKIDSHIEYICVFASFQYRQRMRFHLKELKVIRETHTCERAFNLRRESS
jgi:hypothetical protein